MPWPSTLPRPPPPADVRGTTIHGGMGHWKIRYCEDCRWFVNQADCEAPQNRIYYKNSSGLLFRNEKSSEYRLRWITADYQRRMGWLEAFFSKSCGKQGRWFVAK